MNLRSLIEGFLRKMNVETKERASGVMSIMPIVTTMTLFGTWEFSIFRLSPETYFLIAIIVSAFCMAMSFLFRIELRRSDRESGRDFLTGLHNRRSLHNTVENILREGTQSGNNGTEASVMSIGLVDLDKFKKLNDTLGHRAGDAALRIVADRMRRAFRGSDTIARLGGDEFAIIFPRTCLDDAVAKLEMLRETIESDEALAFKDHSLESHRITASIGTICITSGQAKRIMEQTAIEHDFDAVSEVLHLADQLLYKAKEEGRNRVVAASHDDDQNPSQ